MKYLTHLELMRMQVEALYSHNARGRIRSINQWDGGTAPRFFLGRTESGAIWRFREDVPDALAVALEKLCCEESDVHALEHADAYRRLLTDHAPVERTWTGPAFNFSRIDVPSATTVAIDASNADLLRGGFDAWLPDVPHRRPFIAIVEDARAVALCASVRITPAAHEAGVETLPTHRGRGHAVNVVAAWANAVDALGAVPLYSTSWDNAASQRVAAKLGLSMFGVDFHIT